MGLIALLAYGALERFDGNTRVTASSRSGSGLFWWSYRTFHQIALTHLKLIKMEYEIMFLCNTLGIAIIGMIMVYHLIGTDLDDIR